MSEGTTQEAADPSAPAEETRPLRVGHKGADAVRTGNTLESFQAAVEIGVDLIEFDVLRLRDGGLVIAHDWADAARRKPLSLAEGLDAFTQPPLDGVRLDCDLKLPGREAELVAGLRDRGLLARTMVSTMEVSSLQELRAEEPELRLGWTLPKVTRDWLSIPWAKPLLPAVLLSLRARLPGLVTRRAPELEVSAIWAFHRVVTRRLVAACHEVGLELVAWTVDDAARMRELLALGVDGLCSNDPRLFASI